jgi:hypothetical protein
MNNDLDGRLRKALRPVDPGEQFTQGLLTRLANEPARSPPRFVLRPMLRWISAGLAASLLLGVLVAHEWQVRQIKGLAARQQLLEALRVTRDKLDIAYRAVNDKDGSSAGVDPERGT